MSLKPIKANIAYVLHGSYSFLNIQNFKNRLYRSDKDFTFAT